MVEPIHWGILGTGWIANEFALGLKQLRDAELVGVGSHTRKSAQRFAEQHAVPHRHSSYQALASDPDVDVIYVATPNPLHKEHAVLCLKSGKPVLCEKPFALNARQADEVIRAARESKLFLMEAMWSRFFPLMARLRQLLADGAIGDVQMLVADLSIRFDFEPADRRYSLDLGGGALLDLGEYLVSFASIIMGSPAEITTLAHLRKTGANSPVEAILMGTKGQIRLHPWWVRPSKLTLSPAGEETTTVEMPFEGNGYQFEAAEVMACEPTSWRVTSCHWMRPWRSCKRWMPSGPNGV